MSRAGSKIQSTRTGRRDDAELATPFPSNEHLRKKKKKKKKKRKNERKRKGKVPAIRVLSINDNLSQSWRLRARKRNVRRLGATPVSRSKNAPGPSRFKTPGMRRHIDQGLSERPSRETAGSSINEEEDEH